MGVGDTTEKGVYSNFKERTTEETWTFLNALPNP
jgi:hypothetical protein